MDFLACSGENKGKSSNKEHLCESSCLINYLHVTGSRSAEYHAQWMDAANGAGRVAEPTACGCANRKALVAWTAG